MATEVGPVVVDVLELLALLGPNARARVNRHFEFSFIRRLSIGLHLTGQH